MGKDINTLAMQAYRNAIRRGKTTELYSHVKTLSGLLAEVSEYDHASEKLPSEHLAQYTEAQEELADVLIVCLTELYSRGVDVEQIIVDKINFNETRVKL